MKTNVSIKFNSIEEYREIEKKLEELGYVVVKEKDSVSGYVYVNNKVKMFLKITEFSYGDVYNSLEEFLKD